MLAQWLGDVVGRMHRNRITITQVAREMGVTREYLSMILNGHREPDGARERLEAAVDAIIAKGAKTDG